MADSLATVTQGTNDLATAVGTKLAEVELGVTASDRLSSEQLTMLQNIEGKLDAVLEQDSGAASVTSGTTNNTNVVSLKSFAANDPSIAVGMCRKTGKRLSGIEHLEQSITIIITTLIGERVMRRLFGCGLFELIDDLSNEFIRINLIATVAEALDRWEPRFTLKKVNVSATREEQGKGKLFFSLMGTYKGKDIGLEVAA